MHRKPFVVSTGSGPRGADRLAYFAMSAHGTVGQATPRLHERAARRHFCGDAAVRGIGHVAQESSAEHGDRKSVGLADTFKSNGTVNADRFQPIEGRSGRTARGPARAPHGAKRGRASSSHDRTHGFAEITAEGSWESLQALSDLLVREYAGLMKDWEALSVSSRKSLSRPQRETVVMAKTTKKLTAARELDSGADAATYLLANNNNGLLQAHGLCLARRDFERSILQAALSP